VSPGGTGYPAGPRTDAAEHPFDPSAPPGRYRRRRWLAVLLALVVLLAGAAAGGRQVLLHAARFRVSQVEVTGTTGLDPAVVRAAAGVRLGEPLVSVRTEEVHRRVAAIPRLATVDVRRLWPGTVEVTVTERTPVALAASAAGPVLVDATGTAYELAPRPAPRLPRLAADLLAPDDPATRAGLAVLAELPRLVRDQLGVVRAEGPSEVTLLLADGKQVRWGSPDDPARKAAVLTALLSQPGTIYDVSAPDLPTIRR
jgi:cell division protein FtsQ